MTYVFECMITILFGDVNSILNSTGQTLVGKDIGVGFLGYLTVVSLIVGIGNLIPFLLYNREKTHGYIGLKQASRKYLLITSIIFLALCPISIIINVFVCCFA